jgi:hypothetical protein
MINKFTIYGERCSGTNYLEDIITKNFDVNITWDYGWKHFFGHQDLSNSDEVLFICIIRDPVKYINSLWREKHHFPNNLRISINNYLNNEFYSINENNEIMEDRNMYTKNRYKNIFELRHTKNKFLIEDLPQKVKNYILIKYEDLLINYNNTINLIKDKGLTIRNNIKYPLNTLAYKKIPTQIYDPRNKIDYIKKEIILKNPNFNDEYEKKLGYL